MCYDMQLLAKKCMIAQHKISLVKISFKNPFNVYTFMLSLSSTLRKHSFGVEVRGSFQRHLHV